MLCEKCFNIHSEVRNDELFNVSPTYKYEWDEAIGDIALKKLKPSPPVFYEHHASKEALELSSQKGCQFCAAIFQRLFCTFSGSTTSVWCPKVLFRRPTFANKWASRDDFQEWNIWDWIHITCEGRQVTTTYREAPSGPWKDIVDALTYSQTKHEDLLQAHASREMGSEMILSDCSQFPKALKDICPKEDWRLFSPWLDRSTTSAAALKLASMWLHNCDTNHQSCQKFSGLGKRPLRSASRLLQIEDPSCPFLVSLDREGVPLSAMSRTQTPPRRAQYAALSYKWGSTVKYMTESSNLEQHEKKIPMERLPQTFKDAISVAHLLGFAYLWIDALCIVQDVIGDLVDEIENMDAVFRNSALTIFASAGEDADAGLARPRDPRCFKPCSLTIKCTFGEWHASSDGYHKLDDVPPENSPLISRGWVLQEHVLSPRGLYFGNSLHWQCICDTTSEADPQPRGIVDSVQKTVIFGQEKCYSGGFDGFNLLRLWIEYEDPMLDRTTTQRDNHYDAWYAMVAAYAARSLSYRSDTLRALAGVARAFASTHGCSYYSGLWKEDLQVGLGWYVTSLRSPDATINPPRIDLPSWSWISCWGQAIGFRSWENHNILCTMEGVQLPVSSGDSRPERNKYFGVTTTRELTLVGCIRLAAVREANHDTKTNQRREWAKWFRNLHDPATGELVGGIAFDSKPDLKNLIHVHCLLITVREKCGEWQLTALAIVPTDSSNAKYKRVGLAFIKKSDWFGIMLHDDPSACIRQFLCLKRMPRTYVRAVVLE